MATKAEQLAKLLVEYSLDVKKGENVIIDGHIIARELIVALYKEILLKGANPILDLDLHELEKLFYTHAKEHQIKKFPEYLHHMVKISQKYLFIDTIENMDSLSEINPKKINQRETIMEPINEHIFNSREKIRSCISAFPCKGYARAAGMSEKQYANFVYSSCLQNWKKASKEIDKILKIFKKGKRVHLIGRGVDLKFKIHGKLADKDDGRENMPGGEVYMAPLRESLNGWIKFDYPAMESGREVSGILARFKNGKAVEIKTKTHQDFFRKILKRDKNAGYVGEFGIGMNKKIKRFTKNLLFDEKIGGTIHLAFGMAYKENGGGNKSTLHLDIVKDMHKGKIILDGRVVQENGIWKI